MPHIEIYRTTWCPYCTRAKALLDKKGAAYVEIDIEKENRRDEMEERAKRKTVPQIFINGKHIGGCDDLYALDGQGGLDPLLAASS